MNAYQIMKIFLMAAAVGVLIRIALVQQDINFHLAGERCYESAE